MLAARLRTPTRLRLDSFIRVHASGSLTLDVGCGAGPYAHLYPRRVAVDLRPGPGVRVQADICRLPFPDDTFEVVLCTEVLEHVAQPETAVEELRRVSRVGGKCVLSTRFAYPIHEEVDYYRFTKLALRHLFGNWQEVRVDEDTSGFATLATFAHYLLGEKKTWPWKPIKLLWLLLWFPLQWFYQVRSPNGARHSRALPSGYHVVARKGTVSSATLTHRPYTGARVPAAPGAAESGTRPTCAEEIRSGK